MVVSCAEKKKVNFIKSKFEGARGGYTYMEEYKKQGGYVQDPYVVHENLRGCGRLMI
mgnify:CR=1 FL=1